MRYRDIEGEEVGRIGNMGLENPLDEKSFYKT
jgi:hypothetical protein